MPTPDSSSASAAVSALAPEAPHLPVGSILELLTSPAVGSPCQGERSWPPSHVLRFIRACDSNHLIAAGRELDAVVTGGDWLPFERALNAQMDPLRSEISRTIISSLTKVRRDSALSSIIHGGYQIHLDTMDCFWVGHPATRANLETLVSDLVKKAAPFKDAALNQTVAHTLADGISTGTLDLPHLEYDVLKPDFITLTCQPSVRLEAWRRATQEQPSRASR